MTISFYNPNLFIIFAYKRYFTMDKEKCLYCTRDFLNEPDNYMTGSVCCYDGITDFEEGMNRQMFIEIADCKGKVRLHKQWHEHPDRFIDKLVKLRNHINKFITHLYHPYYNFIRVSDNTEITCRDTGMGDHTFYNKEGNIIHANELKMKSGESVYEMTVPCTPDWVNQAADAIMDELNLPREMMTKIAIAANINKAYNRQKESL